MVSPLQPREFFLGTWDGEGELLPHPLVRWFVPKQRMHLSSKPTWLSDKLWMVKESFHFSSGNVISRTMFAEIVAPDRLHVTADDMPMGADITLSENGFRFTPYYIWAKYRGRRWQLQCFDENTIDDKGTIHDTIRMYFLGMHVATMYLRVNRSQ